MLASSCWKLKPRLFVQARVLATIGVTRGLGDHDLKVHDSNIYIKPFLSCCPEVSSIPAGSEQTATLANYLQPTPLTCC